MDEIRQILRDKNFKKLFVGDTDNTLIQFFRYVFVGGLAFVVDFALSYLLFRFVFNEQKEFDTIEEDITALEERLSAIDDEMGQNASDFVKLRELTEEKEEKEALLEEKMERWEYLTEIFEEMNS